MLNKNAETKILIVGLGLLGGSYARALKKKGCTVFAIEKNQASLDFALKEGIIDEGSGGIGGRGNNEGNDAPFYGAQGFV
jgi:prephenate dehydrogenase